MGRMPIQLSTYVDEDMEKQVEAATEKHDMSRSEILREGLRRQLQLLEGEKDHE